MKGKRDVSTRTRFEIFKRDGFRCVYCGATPVVGPLHVDHVVAVANGGSNSCANLVTACADCNLGKSGVPLERRRETPVATTADLDHSRQILEYLETQRAVEAARTTVVDAVANRWEETIGAMTEEMYSRIPGLIREWPIEKLCEAIKITSGRVGSPGASRQGKRTMWACCSGRMRKCSRAAIESPTD